MFAAACRPDQSGGCARYPQQPSQITPENTSPARTCQQNAYQHALHMVCGVSMCKRPHGHAASTERLTRGVQVSLRVARLVGFIVMQQTVPAVRKVVRSTWPWPKVPAGAPTFDTLTKLRAGLHVSVAQRNTQQSPSYADLVHTGTAKAYWDEWHGPYGSTAHATHALSAHGPQTL